MRDEYVKAIDEIKASEEFKQSMIRSMSTVRQETRNEEKRKSGRNVRGRIVMVTVSCAILLLLAISASLVLRPDSRATVFDGFTVTVYAADGTAVPVKPNVEFPLGEYSMLMSQVPGFPVTVSSEDGDRIRIQASEGELLLWNPADSKVLIQGSKATVQSGETFYWSPSAEGAQSGAAGTLEITAYRQETKIGSAEIEIKSENGQVYKGEFSE